MFASAAKYIVYSLELILLLLLLLLILLLIFLIFVLMSSSAQLLDIRPGFLKVFCTFGKYLFI